MQNISLADQYFYLKIDHYQLNISSKHISIEMNILLNYLFYLYLSKNKEQTFINLITSVIIMKSLYYIK